MSIRQLDYCCWELSDPGDEDDKRHLKDKARADTEIKEAVERNPESKASVTLLASPCWIVQCDGDCDVVIDQEGEGYTVHHEAAAEAQDTARSWEWAVMPGEFGGQAVYCPEDKPDDAELLPPSPADQEAAGQMPLPGVPSP